MFFCDSSGHLGSNSNELSPGYIPKQNIPKWDNSALNVKSIHYSSIKNMDMTQRAFYQASLYEFFNESNDSIIGKLSIAHTQDLVQQQTNAWNQQLTALKENLYQYSSNSNGIFLEFVIPRMGKRTDVVLMINGLIFVVEYKVGATSFARHSKDQVVDYALDLKHFHEGSHHACVVPILISTEAREIDSDYVISDDGLAEIICINTHGLRDVIQNCCNKFSSLSIE